MAIVFVPRGMCNAYNEGAEKARINMKNEIKHEILSLILMMIMDFELALLAFDCYFRPISEYDYLYGSVFTIALIVTITLTCVVYSIICRLIDEFVVVSK